MTSSSWVHSSDSLQACQGVMARKSMGLPLPEDPSLKLATRVGSTWSISPGSATCARRDALCQGLHMLRPRPLASSEALSAFVLCESSPCTWRSQPWHCLAGLGPSRSHCGPSPPPGLAAGRSSSFPALSGPIGQETVPQSLSTSPIWRSAWRSLPPVGVSALVDSTLATFSTAGSGTSVAAGQSVDTAVSGAVLAGLPAAAQSGEGDGSAFLPLRFCGLSRSLRNLSHTAAFF
mmetsp:Transcript_48708/g.137709  ORF Transcript_48708/g.137709 Transcript_48708/m.137709 type:complete len:234 (+) Transcript_48708:198-899(+)